MKEEKEIKKEKKKESGEVSRRDFIVGAGTVVVGGAIGATLLSGCNGGTKTVEVTKTVPTTVTVGGQGATVTQTETKTVAGEGGQIVTVTDTKTVTEPGSGGAVYPWQELEEQIVKDVSYGLACFDVKNGKIIRGRSLHFDSKYPELKTWTLKAKGKSATPPNCSMSSPFNFCCRHMVDSPVKLLYPLKRIDWEPGGDSAKINPQNRGKSKYKRISWDEAATIVASELDRVASTYGPEAVCAYGAGMGEPQNVVGNLYTSKMFLDYYLLSKYGGMGSSMSFAGGSFIGGEWGMEYVWGFKTWGYELGSLYTSVMNNTEMCVTLAGDIENKTWGVAAQMTAGFIVRFMKELGIKIIHVDPIFNMGAAAYADTWIPIIAGTDCALMCAIAYTWIQEDSYDKDYVATHTIGFDKWKAYVMGDEDGTPKTPEWASPICGIPEWTIKALAREWAAKVTSVIHGSDGGGICRAPYCSEPSRMEVYMLGMQGWENPEYIRFVCGSPWVSRRDSGLFPPKSDTAPVVAQAGPNYTITTAMMTDIPAATVNAARTNRQTMNGNNAEAILNPPTESWDIYGVKTVYPKEGKSEIHMFYFSTDGFIGMGNGANKYFQAWTSPKIEFIVAQNQYLRNATSYADLILPTRCALENEDIKIGFTQMNSTLMYEKALVKPRGEAKTDFGVCIAIAEKLNFAEKILSGYANEEDYYQGQRRKAYEESGWAEKISWDDLAKNTYVSEGPPDNWESQSDPQANNFYNEPDNYPLQTPSGLFEFESQFIKENFPDDKERPPVAHYVRGGPASEGWTHNEDRLISERAKDYPLVVVCSVPSFAMHTNMSDLPPTREITKQKCYDGYMYENLWINPVDAAARGIKHGDIVRFYTEIGSVLGAAFVTERIVPGVISMEKGRQVDYIIPDQIDRGGAPNLIAPNKPLSKHCTVGGNYNGYLAQVEKVTGNQMDEWRANYPDAFTRDYDPAFGALFRSWIEEEGDN